MNNLKLIAVELCNFKAFKSKLIKIESRNLSLLDGPNGFGKTTFFDALELLFTGKVARYNNWDKEVSNQRAKFGRHPLLNGKASDVDKLFVQVKFLHNQKELTLKREAKANKLLDIRRVESAVFDLFEFVNNEWRKIDDAEQFIESTFGNNYLKNYGVMHYIQQEESTQILKSKETTKQEKINHLFNVATYQSKANKIDTVLKVLGKLKSPSVQTAIDDLKKNINTEKQQLSSSNLTEYTRLIKELEHPWDKEKIPEDLQIIQSWLDQNSDLSRLNNLVNNKKTFFDHRFNQQIKSELLLIDKQGAETDKAIVPLLQFGHHLAAIKEYSEQLALIKLAEDYLHATEKGLLASINNKQALPSEKLYKVCLKEFNRETLSIEIETLTTLSGSAGDLEKILNKIKRLHAELTQEHHHYNIQTKENSEQCPTCGHSWDSHDKLIQQFEKQKIKINETLIKISGDFTSKLKQVEDSYIQPIRRLLVEYINPFKETKPYLEQICQLSEQQINFLTRLGESYKKYDIDLQLFRSADFNLEVSADIEKLKARVASLYRAVDFNLLENDFDYLFQEILGNKESALEILQTKEIELKKSFLRYQYALAQQKDLRQKEQKLEQQQKQFKKASEYYEKLKQLRIVYTTAIKQYISDISQGIEILFHIYTGRLLQNYSQGLGLFIEHTGDKISFREKSDSETDALFSMSSGQLSALSMAFTLALNHKYAQNNLLLIDDPMQTMDEINISAFIDLLRYEFKNRQIFISTHEDHTSVYLRYKFLRAGLERARINFMALEKET